MVTGSRGTPEKSSRPKNTAMARMKLKIGPAATVAARAQSGAPCIVSRSSSGVIWWIISASAPAEAAFASPRNFT